MNRIVSQSVKRAASTLTKEAGDISSVFPSLSGKAPEPLPARFGDLKKRLVAGKEAAIKASWHRLLKSLREEIDKIKEEGSNVSSAGVRLSFFTELVGHTQHWLRRRQVRQSVKSSTGCHPS
jgi:hypothetical protein